MDEVQKKITELYKEIDECINDLVKARDKKDDGKELIALSQMESLMVKTLPTLLFILEWKEMMKESVAEGYVTCFPYADGIEIMFGGKQYDVIDKLHKGDKVKVIIIKED